MVDLLVLASELCGSVGGVAVVKAALVCQPLVTLLPQGTGKPKRRSSGSSLRHWAVIIQPTFLGPYPPDVPAAA